MATEMQFDILERIRVLEADIEHRRDAIVEQQLLPITNPRHLLMRDRFVAEQTELLKKTASDLLDLYLDGDELPQAQEVQLPLEGMMRYFNARVATIREYYRNHPNAEGDVSIDPIEPDMDHLFSKDVFSKEEHYGTRLHLMPLFTLFDGFRDRCARATTDRPAMNVVPIKDIKYESFMFNMTLSFSRTPQELKLREGQRYYAFVSSLRDYLVRFYKNVKPFAADHALLKEQLGQAKSAFEGYWAQVESAAPIGAASSHFEAATVPRSSPFLVAPWDLRMLPAPSSSTTPSNDNRSDTSSVRALAKRIALAEAEVAILVQEPNGVMCSIVRASATACQADTHKMPHELQMEEEAAEEAFLASVEAMEERLAVAKTKAVPLAGGDGFDLDLLNLGANAATNANSTTNASSSHVISGETGTAAQAAINLAGANGGGGPAEHVDSDGFALPTWQIKSEGRRKKFKCEICAGEVFHGPKMWHAHFKGSRHQEGLRRLGILNGPAYFGVETIAGAEMIHAQLKESASGGSALFGPNGSKGLMKRIREEYNWQEVEDEHAGIVLRRKDFESLRRR